MEVTHFMTENHTIQAFYKKKTIQLIFFIILEASFFLILITNKELRSSVFTDTGLFTLCFITWILCILILLSLFYDIYQLRSFSVTNLELQQLAYLDNKTGIPNRTSLDIIFKSYSTEESLKDVGCCLFTIDNLNMLNESVGREAGDEMIQNFCTILEETGDKYGFVGRNGGNEFIMVINNCTDELMEHFFNTLDNRLKLHNEEHTQTPIIINRAYTLNSQEHHASFSRLLTATYNKLI